MTRAEPAFMEDLRALVRGDGLDFEFLNVDAQSGTLNLRLFSGPQPCAACAISSALLEEIAGPIVRKAYPRITRIVIQDHR